MINLEPGSWADWFSGSMSAIAVVVALAAYPISNRQRRQEDRQRDVEVSRAVGWKILSLVNQNGDIERHIQSSLDARQPMWPPNMKFPLVRPLGVPDRKPQELNQTETDFLLKSGAAELLQELELCFGRYSSIVYTMREYKSRHEALYELMPHPISNDGMTFTHRLSPEEFARVKPYTLMLESLIDGMISLLGENTAKLQQCLVRYQDDMTAHFGKAPMTFEVNSSLTPPLSR